MRAKDFTSDHEQEADYGPEYQAMVQRVGQKAREQEKRKPVDVKDLARRLQAIPDEEVTEYTDPELARTLAYAGIHYPNYKKKPEAFMKWASRAIVHSEEQDNLHNSQFAELHHELDQLKQLVSKISQRSQ